MENKLIAELRAWWARREIDSTSPQYWENIVEHAKAHEKEFNEILSRHEAEQGSADAVIKGLQKAVEEAEKMVEYNAELVKERDAKIAVLSKIEAEQGEGLRDMPWETIKEITCYDRACFKECTGAACHTIVHGRIVLSRFFTPAKTEEPLEELAKRKGAQVSYEETYTLFFGLPSDMPSVLDRQFHLEREARAYLEALPDAKGGVV